MKNKVVYVPAHFEAVGENKTIDIPTGETRKGFFGREKKVMRKETRWEQTGWSDSKIDGKRLADDLSNVVRELNEDGYEVISITPVTNGDYDWQYQLEQGGRSNKGFGGYGLGYGYSYTQSLIVVAKRP